MRLLKNEIAPVPTSSLSSAELVIILLLCAFEKRGSPEQSTADARRGNDELGGSFSTKPIHRQERTPLRP